MRALALVIVAVAFAAGCAAPTPTPEPTLEPTSTPRPTATRRPTATTVSVREGSEDDPWSADDVVTVTFPDGGAAEVELLGMVTGADAYETLLALAPDVGEIEPTQGVVLLHARIAASDDLSGELLNWTPEDFAISAGGRTVRGIESAGVFFGDDGFPLNLNPGAEADGWMAFVGPKAESYKVQFLPQSRTGGQWFGPVGTFGDPPAVTGAEPANAPAAPVARPAATEAPAAEAPPPAPEPAGGLTLANYNRLVEGMSYAEVAAILGSPGEQGATSTMGGYTASIYSWTRSGSDFATVSVSFMNDAMTSKAQVGLD